MQAPKIYANYKCECYGNNLCSCRAKDSVCSIFTENVADVADAIAEVMVICGIHQCKARASTEVVTHAFEHYDEIRHRVDAVPHKRLCREDFIHDLGLKCMMTRMEAQLAYSIAKRAFKAFYHGTCEGGIHNPLLEAQLIHSQECMWVHAARRTAQIFAAYEGMFLSAQENYEALIRCVYKRLYDKLLRRSAFTAQQMTPIDCECKGCLKKAINFSKDSLRTRGTASVIGKTVSVSTTATKLAGEPSVLTSASCKLMPLSCEIVAPTEMAKQNAKLEEQARLDKEKQWQSVRPGENPVLFCEPCMCPRLICDCNAKPGIPSLECSQGPYVCRWLPVIPEEELEMNPCDIMVEEHECPVDCIGIDTDDDICDAECICDCAKSCECEELSSDYEEGEDDAFEMHTEVAEEHEMDMSDGPTYAGCCVMLNHIAEEMQLAENSLSIAHIEGHRNEASKRGEHQVTLTLTTPKTAIASEQQKPRQLSEEELKNEAAEISKLLASMI